MWLCRDKYERLMLCSSKPVLSELKTRWVCEGNNMYIDFRLYPEVTFENSPQEVELVIKK